MFHFHGNFPQNIGRLGNYLVLPKSVYWGIWSRRPLAGRIWPIHNMHVCWPQMHKYISDHFLNYHWRQSKCCLCNMLRGVIFGFINHFLLISSVRSSNSHPDLLLIHHHQHRTTTHPLFQITPVLNTGLSLSEPLQLYKGYNAI